MKLSKEFLSECRDIVNCKDCDSDGFSYFVDGLCPICSGLGHKSLPTMPEFLKSITSNPITKENLKWRY